jgi:hypothetical protein
MSSRRLIALALAATLAALQNAGPAHAAERNKSDLLEQMAREKFGQLSNAEVLIVRSAPERDIKWASPHDDPADPINDPVHADAWGPERTIRAALLVWLSSDPDAARLVHPSGAGIIGARISGPLDLSYQNVPFPLTLVRCAITDGIDISNARLRGLDLRASVTGPIVGNMAVVSGDITLTFGKYGQVLLYGAAIDGTLDFSAGRVESGEPPAISGVNTVITGDVKFHQDFATNGIVDFRFARITHTLSFNHARFFGTQENGLNAERAVIQEALYWVAITMTPHTLLDLEDAHANVLGDDEASWPAPGNLMLSGFEYNSFGADSPSDADSRLRWLARQPPGYRPQPYAELAKVLMAAGENEDAITVEIAQRVAQRREGGLRWSARIWNLMLQMTIGYGFVPARALWWILGFVVFGTVLFGWGYSQRVISPTEEAAYESFMKSGTTPPHYPPFNAFVYSLENFLPVVELHQGEYWRPNPSHGGEGHLHSRGEGHGYAGTLLRWYLWIHILSGWILTPLLAAGLSGLIHVG